jgi:hypothetical protein
MPHCLLYQQNRCQQLLVFVKQRLLYTYWEIVPKKDKSQQLSDLVS